jgi:hypothetical protein
MAWHCVKSRVDAPAPVVVRMKTVAARRPPHEVVNSTLASVPAGSPRTADRELAVEQHGAAGTPGRGAGFLLGSEAFYRRSGRAGATSPGPRHATMSRPRSR